MALEEPPVAASGGDSVSDQQPIAAAVVAKQPEEPRSKFSLKPPKVHVIKCITVQH